jgi:hypothetical protein
VEHVYPDVVGVAVLCHPRGDRAFESVEMQLQLPLTPVLPRGFLILASDVVDFLLGHQGHLVLFKGQVDVESDFSVVLGRGPVPAQIHRASYQPSETGVNPNTTEAGQAWLKKASG